jgi:hypothetical protein
MAENLANWGEFVSAIAVVISLIYVGLQLKATVAQAKVDSYTKSTELWSQFTSAVAGDGETWRVFHQGSHDYDSLDQAEKSRFSFIVSMYFGIIDTIMTHQKAGVYPNIETYQRALDQAYAVFSMPGTQQWFHRSKGRIFAPTVEDYLVTRRKNEDEGK